MIRRSGFRGFKAVHIRKPGTDLALCGETVRIDGIWQRPTIGDGFTADDPDFATCTPCCRKRDSTP